MYMFDRCCEHQRTHLSTRSLQDVHMCSLFVQRLGNEDGGVQLVYQRTCCLAWGVILTEGKDRSVVYVFSILTLVGVYVGVCV